MSDYLRCPACCEPCTTILCCRDAHEECTADAGMWLDRDEPSWCEDRRGTCQCGASLYVDVDDGHAYLVEEASDV
jgi:hypothetical protein